MRRTEMVEEMVKAFSESLGDRQGALNLEETMDTVLAHMESLGMLPPSVTKNQKGLGISWRERDWEPEYEAPKRNKQWD